MGAAFKASPSGQATTKAYHQDTKRTKKHKVNVLFFWVKLSALGVLVVRFLALFFNVTDD